MGGVCGGLANYLRVDASVVRIIFAILLFGAGTGFLVYLLLWIILPKKSLKSNLTKRLYRNPDEKIIGGVASGLAAYFNIAVWIPRLIFAFPLLMGIINSIFKNIFWHFDPFPSVFFGSFGGSLTLIYLVLWAVIPEANTASEKLEMRGEKIDLNTIKNTIQEDLVGFKDRADKYGKVISEKVNNWGDEVNATTRKANNRFGHAIGIVFKAFFLFIMGMIAFALLMALIGVLIGGVAFFPFKNFFLDGLGENVLAWVTIFGLLIVPIIGFVFWLVRRILKVKNDYKYLGATIGVIWTFGLFACVTLAGMILSNFSAKSGSEEIVNITQPTTNKLIVTTSSSQFSYFEDDWFGVHWDNNNAPFYNLSEDSVMLKTVRVSVVQSSDNQYHVKTIKFSRGKNKEIAKEISSNIKFNITQNDSIIQLPKGFVITKKDKFRNQQVLVIIEVPVGKKIMLDKTINDFDWFDMDFKRNHGWNNEWDRKYSNTFSWDDDQEMIMNDKELINPSEKSDIHDELKDLKKELQDIEDQKKEIESKKLELLKESKPSPTTKIENSGLMDDIKKTLPCQVYLSNVLIDKFSL